MTTRARIPELPGRSRDGWADQAAATTGAIKRADPYDRRLRRLRGVGRADAPGHQLVDAVDRMSFGNTRQDILDRLTRLASKESKAAAADSEKNRIARPGIRFVSFLHQGFNWPARAQS